MGMLYSPALLAAWECAVPVADDPSDAGSLWRRAAGEKNRTISAWIGGGKD
jgi:hypothetical protein